MAIQNYALIDPTGLCVNVIVVDDAIAADFAPTGGKVLPLAETPGSPGIGWTLNGTTWTPPAPRVF